jgi:tetratricopeptide (TPR) repeat protein
MSTCRTRWLSRNWTLKVTRFCVALSLCISLTAAAQKDEEDLGKTRNLSAEAEKLARSGSHQQAINLISGELSGTNTWSTAADAQLSFTLGWLFDELARVDRKRREECLEKALDWYQRAVARSPGHSGAIENTAGVLRDLGRPAEAIALLEQNSLTNLHPEQAYQRLMLLGDLQTGVKEPARALKTYVQAFELVRANEGAPSRIVSLYSARIWTNSAALLKHCRNFSEAGLPQVASRGYDQIVQRSPHDRWVSSDAALEAFEGWVEAESIRGTLSQAGLSRVPAGTIRDGAAVRELMACFENPTNPSLEFQFWRSSTLRQHICASALRTMAEQQRRANAPTNAAALLKQARKVAPEFYAYGRELKGRPMVGLDSALDLAALSQAFPILDPNGEELAHLEFELLGSKNAAYAEQDLTAMQKFHTVLGLIYAERGRWDSDGLRAAPYHLRRAVSTAQQLAQRSPAEYKPFPHLTRILAEGLVARTNADLATARTLCLDAAQGFLDEDDVNGAEQMLGKVQDLSLKLGKPMPKSYDDLETLVRFRKLAGALRPSDLKVAPGASGAEYKIGTNSLSGVVHSTSLDPAFLQRQTVRGLNDLTIKARGLGADAVADQLHKVTVEQLQTRPGVTWEDYRKVAASSAGSGARIKRVELMVQDPKSSKDPELKPSQRLLTVDDLKRASKAGKQGP